MKYNKKQIDETSKFLSYILRHQPESIALSLDSEGWADIDSLIQLSQQSEHPLNLELLTAVVGNNDKKRFSFSHDGSKIRAAQGHSSLQVNISFKQQTPPEILYHGTASRFIDTIQQQGLTPQSRHYVHLSAVKATALNVGQRYGKPVILEIKALNMHQQGFKFYLADNHVWLTEVVPPQFIEK